MRDQLKRYANNRHRFRAQVKQFGKKPGFRGNPKNTVLFVDVVDATSEDHLCDHLWMTVGKRLRELDVSKGDVVEFDARADEYEKGYTNAEYAAEPLVSFGFQPVTPRP